MRTERDIPQGFVFLGILGLVFLIWMAEPLKVNLLGAALIVIFGFLFVTVASRLAGILGISSNPISGMTVATLLLTCLLFVLLGWVGAEYRLMALSIAAVVCIATSNGATTSQDLKTGYIVGATPKKQQIALLIGALTSAVVIGFTLLLLNSASTIYHKVDAPHVRVEASQLTKTDVEGPDGAKYGVTFFADPVGTLSAGKYLVDANGHPTYLVDPGINGALKTRDDGTTVQKYEAPKARLMALIIDGILTQKLPWTLVLLGVFISLVMELAGVSSLPFSVGLYLPLSSSTPIFVGGMVRWLADKRRSRKEKAKDGEDAEESPGVLLSSGYIGGGAIAGIVLALFAVKPEWSKALDMSSYFPAMAQSDEAPYVFFAVIVVFMYMVARGLVMKAK